ncbi:hypothetical protein GGR40_003834 [Novosphingobium gossypii]
MVEAEQLQALEAEQITSRTQAYACLGMLDQCHGPIIQIRITFGHGGEDLQLFAEIDLGDPGTAHDD